MEMLASGKISVGAVNLFLNAQLLLAKDINGELGNCTWIISMVLANYLREEVVRGCGCILTTPQNYECHESH